jgi:hypothetical protein
MEEEFCRHVSTFAIRTSQGELIFPYSNVKCCIFNCLEVISRFLPVEVAEVDYHIMIGLMIF